ncbi:YgaP family membrane protein [Paenibacillus sp. LjRoot56]|uniref:YgaP family membrane protein n=1 Tax=Paenibacillus sp. LjRoot56 TaxID=3342333 RepID=UPI003ECFF9E5
MKNVGGTDRAIRVILGIALLSLFYVLPGYWKLVGLIAVPLLITGLAQKCGINKLLGRNTCRLR